MRILFAITILVGLVASSCRGGATKDQPKTEKAAEAKRLVSLSGSITEVIYALDAEKELVAVDVTSTYPAEAEKLANLGHVRGVTAESIIGTKPTHVLAFEDELNPQLKSQLEKAGIEVIAFKHEFSVEGAKKTITDIAAWLDKKDEAKVLTAKIDNDLVSVKKPANESTLRLCSRSRNVNGCRRQYANGNGDQACGRTKRYGWFRRLQAVDC
jgi:iron complex transport system substrate-binding protein